NNPIATSPMDVYVIPVVFAFTFVIEGVGLWYLLRILNLNLKIMQALTLALLLDLVTFFLGNYVLLPLLSPYYGIFIDASVFILIGLIVVLSFLLGFLYGRRGKIAQKGML
ncbi:MAG: hypothetical protein NWE81_01450, partial [Candidatus Bathyarchaeota archaeon]|nr:hypothetical protein [Candidatus Bathyarchaeota archaeon]